MAYRALELVIQSAQNLSNVHRLHSFRNLKPFALVSIRDNNNNPVSPEQQTTIDEGNTNPTWNFHVTFNIDITRVVENQLALVVKLKSHRKSGDKDVGEVRVRITDLEGFGDANDVAERHVRKNVVNLDGTSQQVQGTLNFSYRFGNTVQHPPASTVNTGNHPPQNVPQGPGVARRVANRVIEEIGTAMATGAVAAALGAVLYQPDDEPAANNGAGSGGADDERTY